MEKLEIYSSEDITVWCYPALRLIHHQIHQFCRNLVFREALMSGTEAMIRHGAIGWLSDDRRNAAISPDDEIWGREVWFPRTRAAGWQYWAVVLPESQVGRMNVDRQVDAYLAMGITAQKFTDVDRAMGWINRAISGSVWSSQPTHKLSNTNEEAPRPSDRGLG